MVSQRNRRRNRNFLKSQTAKQTNPTPSTNSPNEESPIQVWKNRKQKKQAKKQGLYTPPKKIKPINQKPQTPKPTDMPQNNFKLSQAILNNKGKSWNVKMRIAGGPIIKSDLTSIRNNRTINMDLPYESMQVLAELQRNNAPQEMIDEYLRQQLEIYYMPNHGNWQINNKHSPTVFRLI